MATKTKQLRNVTNPIRGGRNTSAESDQGADEHQFENAECGGQLAHRGDGHRHGCGLRQHP